MLFAYTTSENESSGTQDLVSQRKHCLCYNKASSVLEEQNPVQSLPPPSLLFLTNIILRSFKVQLDAMKDCLQLHHDQHFTDRSLTKE